ncbi:MAG TPA: transglycosylase SLT domain-containing protein [bacterium]|nr:transglycosylase SLT domain-containing protein [bacterium]
MTAPRSTLRLFSLTILLSLSLLLCSSCAVGTADDSISASAPPPNPLAEKETAARKLPPMAQGRELVRLAREHEQAGRYQQASRLFAETGDLLPAYRAAALDEAARNASAAHDHAAALTMLQTLRTQYPQSPLTRNTAGRIAQSYVDLDKKDEAVAAYRQAAAAAAGATLRAYYLVRAAELLEEQKQTADAAALYRQLLEKTDPHRYSIRALEGLHRTAFAGDVPAQIDHAAKFGLRMYTGGAYQQAGPALDRAIRLRRERGEPWTAMPELVDKAADSFFRTHHNDQAAAYFELLKTRQDAKYGDILYQLARLYTRLGDAPKARENYQLLTKHGAGYGARRTGWYQLSLLNIEDNKYTDAYGYYSRRLKEKRSANSFLHWKAGWTAMMAGNLKTADGHFAAILNDRRGEEKERASFWRAQVLLKQKRVTEAMAILTRLNKNDPTGYYGWRSAEILQAHKRPAVTIAQGMNRHNTRGPKLTPINSAWWAEFDELKNFPRLQQTTELGFWRAANREMVSLEIPKKIKAPQRFALARVAHDAKAYPLARKLVYGGGVYQYLKGHRDSLLDTYYPLYLPLGYAENVERYAKQFRLPPALVYAIILNESNYRPTVESPAYAVGLMQVMPQTGQEIAAALGEDYHEDSLYDPETNVRYGCWYLRHLLDTLGDDPAYAVAAYNAGPKAVAKWLRNKQKIEQAYFIAEIPYLETNRYVRRVITAMKKYETMLTHRDRAR